MLSLNVSKGEYITINGNIVVQVFPEGGQATLRVEAPREIPIVRGTVLEKGGAPKPEAIAAAERRAYVPKTRTVAEQIRKDRYYEKVNRWAARKRAGRAAIETMERRLAEVESPELRRALREQLEALKALTE